MFLIIISCVFPSIPLVVIPARSLTSSVFIRSQERRIPTDTTAQDVDGWDSFTRVNLILAIELEFGIRFTTSDVERMHSVGDLVTFIQQYTQQ